VLERIVAAGASGAVFQADLAERGSAERLAEAVLERFARVDILVNNAGSLVRRVPGSALDDDFFTEIVDVNLYTTIACCRAFVPSMVERGSGVVINMSSVAARNGGGPGASLYAATKAAVATFTRGLAKELAPKGIRVNAISPGVVLTPFHERFTSPEMMDALVATIPMGRAATPQEIVGPVLFLASEASSGYVTGQILEVNGGQYSP
jgi:3-oxoacyl-[acyl-carrier protein] reductase